MLLKIFCISSRQITITNKKIKVEAFFGARIRHQRQTLTSISCHFARVYFSHQCLIGKLYIIILKLFKSTTKSSSNGQMKYMHTQREKHNKKRWKFYMQFQNVLFGNNDDDGWPWTWSEWNLTIDASIPILMIHVL